MKPARGFTLVELIVVMVITGIIGVSMLIFFRPTVDAYFDARRRAALTDVADTALQRISRDVRPAVPNSIRTVGNQCFEFLPTSAGGRYRMGADIVSAVADQPLDITQPVTVFDVLSPLNTLPAVGDWVVIGNQNTGDVYAGSNRSQITAVGAGNAVREAALTVNAQQFPPGYDGGRFVVVPNNAGNPAVVYVCSNAGVDAAGNGTGTLLRVRRPFNAALAACPAGGDVLATRVSACTFVYAPNAGATQESGYLWMQLELREAGESVAMAYGVHVSNVP
ncbi:MAG: type II secretion system protein [Dechloromonas sp.]|nr:MAG: type II secretion system protein [Dechloromonas sp.]